MSKILIVDDEKDVLFMIEELVKSLKHDSETANNMMSVIMDASKKFTRKKMDSNKIRIFTFKYHEAYFLIIAFRGIMKDVNDVIKIYLNELIGSLDKQMK